MNGGKNKNQNRSHNSSSTNNHPGSSGSVNAPKSKEAHESEGFLSGLPLIKQSENSRLLPRFTSILSRNVDDGVNMDDLDQLQLDLEKLISTCAVRNRFLRSESENIDRVEEKRDKKGKSYDKSSSLKRKRPDDRSSKYQSKNGNRPFKKHYPLPATSNSNLIGSELGLIHDLPPKLNLPKNDTSDKFWASVEPYCAPITSSHPLFLDKLIEECSQEIEVKVPEIGDYYANEWNDSALSTEQDLGLGSKAGELKKNGLNAMVDTLSNPKTQRLLAVLIEERVMTSFPGVTGKLKPSDLNILKGAGGPRAAICMDRRLKKDLIEQGILSADDLPKSTSDDEILQELKKCQQELSTVNEYNVEELNRLKVMVMKDLKRQEIKASLDKVDNQILELFNKVLVAKQKHLQMLKLKHEDLEKNDWAKVLKDYEVQTDALLKQQFQLQKDLTDICE